MKKIAILGSTGSIGTQTLEIIAFHPDRFQVVALSAGQNIELLISQAKQFSPKLVSVATKQLADQVKLHLPSHITVVYGEEGLIEAAVHPAADIVVTAIVGSRGLPATLAAIEAGKTIALANKETLVTAGQLVMEKAARYNVPIIPVDSEHSALFQSLNGEQLKTVYKLVLTASGGSFRDRTRSELANVTIEDALRHPNWSMGAKITIDSATMVNKGLEVIEAHWLFGMPYEQIDVVIHPESIIHSMVEYDDSSIIAQLGNPDMRVPIQYALTYPERIESPAKRLNLTAIQQLTFREMDYTRFPCLQLAFECGKLGQSAPTVYNAANEIAVARFLNREVSFLDIERIIETVINDHNLMAITDAESILEVDTWARKYAAII
ncbi:1-deoxy-D-xylulose-5-phosphate reductoisomerase [Paenibacillus yanchengensis]|uniref:1-deoxy-D-xylulose 5-phosphate reductoisomerase n=1 Tax=Paenibacillus yanchengensis TaxID=2035833 RepID=A0ABW4YMB2_9BACL